jgi:hypothetical protein
VTENENGKPGARELSDMGVEDPGEEEIFRSWSRIPPEAENGGLCRHDMVPEWCAFCAPSKTQVT